MDNVKFIDTQPAAKFDDATAYVDIGSSGLETLWNSNTASNGLRFRGSLVFWVKANSTIWGTVTEGTLFGISDAGILGTAQHLRVYKTNVAHTIAVSIFTGIDETTITANIQDHLGGLSEDSWVNFALVWNIPATNSETKPGGGDGEAHLYVQGILVSSAYGLNSYQDFEGTFEAYVASANINAAQLPPVIDSNMSHVMLFVNDLSPQEIAVVANPALFSRREDCDAQYVSNFFAEGRIDFVYRFDNSIATFTDLSAQVVPFDLLPTPLQVNDALYLGSDSHTFGGAVFNLIKGIGFTITWEYWNGVSWGGFTVSDPTNGLRRNGEVAVAWEFPNDWAQNNPGMGITAYWIRAKVATVPPSPWLDSPIQTEGVIYAVSSPYVDLQETDIGGDIPAIGRLTIDVKTASIGNNKVIVGKRSLSRGSNFSSYWNAGRLNLPFGITAFMSVGGAGSFAPSPQFAGGEGANWSPTIVSSGFESIIVWRVASAVSREYEGYYRAFVVIEYGGGTFADGDAALRLDYSAADVGATVTLPPRPIDFANNFIDLGFISFPRSSSVISVSLRGFALDVTGVWDITVVALLLVPVDEWALEVEASTANGISFGDTIIIDSTYDTNAHGRSSASIIERGNPLSGSPYASLLPHSTTGRLEFNHRRQERLWFFFIANGSDGGLGSQLYSVSVDGVKRYLGLRGAE